MTKHDTPNQSIGGKLGNSAHNAVNYGADKAHAKKDEAKAEYHKEQMKGHISGNDSVLDRVEGAFKYAGDKMSQGAHKTSGSYNKHHV